MIYRNKRFRGQARTNSWRKMAMASWAEPKDPTIYGVMELNIEKALNFIAAERVRTGEKITITHFIGKVYGEMLKTFPDVNTQIRFGKFHQRADISVAFQVAIDEAHHADDLTNALIVNIDQKSMADVCRELNTAAKKARTQKDPDYRRIKGLSDFLPAFLLRPAVKLLGFVINSLNIWSPLLGLPKSAFGSVLITNVGSLGLDFAFAALFPPAAVPMIVSTGAIYQGPVFLGDNNFVMKPHMRLCGSIDHRYVDGLQSSKCVRLIRDIFDKPEKYFGHPTTPMSVSLNS